MIICEGVLLNKHNLFCFLTYLVKNQVFDLVIIDNFLIMNQQLSQQQQVQHC